MKSRLSHQGIRSSRRRSPTSTRRPLPPGDRPWCAIEHSTVNYKERARDHQRLAGRAPMADGAGPSTSPAWSSRGTHELVEGRRPRDPQRLGAWAKSHWGGLAQKARVKGRTGWCATPAGMNSRFAMAVGNRGLHRDAVRGWRSSAKASARTAAEVLVTGATGGVGQHRGGAARRARLSRGRLDRQGERGAVT